MTDLYPPVSPEAPSISLNRHLHDNAGEDEAGRPLLEEDLETCSDYARVEASAEDQYVALSKSLLIAG